MKHLILFTSLLLYTMASNAQSLSLPYSVDWSDDAADGWSVIHEGDSCFATQFNVSISFTPCFDHRHTIIDEWVASPALDLSAGAQLKFGWAPWQRFNTRHPGDTLQCWLLDLGAGTKTLLADFAPIGDSSFTHHDTTLTVPPASNNAYIAYRYTNDVDTYFYANIYKVSIIALPTAAGTITFNNNPLNLYPNPAKETINWTVPSTIGAGANEAKLYSITGQLMLTAPVVSGTLNIGKLVPGLYFLKVGSTISRFLKE